MERITKLRGAAQREEQLSKELQGKSFVGEAFRDLCEAGCDPRILRRYLLPLVRLPQQKSKKRYSAAELNRLEKLADQLEQVADELEPFYDLLYHETALRGPDVEYQPWERPTAIRKTLRALANRLKECRKSVESLYDDRYGDLPAGLSNTFALAMRSLLLIDMNNAYEHISFLVKYVEKKTGKPHYREVATLVGAALARLDFTVEDLKMICSRRKGKADKR